MVSFQAPHSPNQNKKRKCSTWEDADADADADIAVGDHHQETFNSSKRSRPDLEMKSLFDIELHLETPLPLEWQRCLDIQSGQIHFYNTRTQKRTSQDPRRKSSSPDPPTSPRDHRMSLNLELNLLPCDSITKTNNSDDDHLSTKHRTTDMFMGSREHRRCPSWLTFERGDQHQEMMATVCGQCHMLVMLCKSSPACPNCKFMHPTDQNPPALFKGSCNLLC